MCLEKRDVCVQFEKIIGQSGKTLPLITLLKNVKKLTRGDVIAII